MTDFNNLSEDQIQALIANASKALKNKQDSKRKEVLAQIKSLADSIGVSFEITDKAPKVDGRQSKVDAKYRNPANPSQTWTGRGLAPKWITESGKDKSEFLIK